MASSKKRSVPLSRRAVLRTAGGAALAGAVVLGDAGTGLAQAGGSAGIAGSWRIAALDEGAPSPQTFFATFTNDGGYIQSSGPGQSTGHGAWTQVGERTVALTFEQFGFVPRIPAPGDQGGPGGPGESGGPAMATLKVRARVELDATGATLRGPYAFEVRLPNGTVIESGTGTAQGTRIGVEPL